MNRLIFAALACIPVACSGDNTAPQATGVVGQWIYHVGRLSDGGQVSCSMTLEDTLSLGRSAGKVQGRYFGGAIRCSGGDVESITMVTGAVVNGTVGPMVNGAQDVSFDFDGSSWHHSGTLTGDRMSGTLALDHTFPGKLKQVHLTGSWTALRRSTIPPPPQPQ